MFSTQSQMVWNLEFNKLRVGASKDYHPSPKHSGLQYRVRCSKRQMGKINPCQSMRITVDDGSNIPPLHLSIKYSHLTNKVWAFFGETKQEALSSARSYSWHFRIVSAQVKCTTILKACETLPD